MLTFLTVEKASNRKFLPLRNKIFEEIKSAEGLEVKHIRYIQRSKKVNFEKIAKACGEEAKRLLVKEDVFLPDNMGLKRFYCDELKSRLCLNMAIKILEDIKTEKGINVAVYDPEGRIADGVGGLLKFTESLTAVTRMTDIYNAEAMRLMEESGAVLNASRRMKSLSKAQLIVAPLKLSAQLPVEKSAVILSVAKPAVAQRCAVYYKYYFNLSESLFKLLPEGFDAEYFASALYTLYGRYDLGSYIPQAVKGGSAAHTIVSLSKYLTNIASNT